MKHIVKHIFLVILTISLLANPGLSAFAANNDEPVYTTLRSVDLGTFNEYRYKITQEFFNLREYFEVNGETKEDILKSIAILVETGYKYLPDNLKNQNYKRELLIDIKRSIKSPGNEIAYTQVIKSLAAYLESVEISSIQGKIEASPVVGNAPLTVTLRGKVSDPTGSQIQAGNYTWWVDEGGRKKVIGRGTSINYTFREEGKFSVFLDVTSSHKNADGYTDVLPFRSRADINVNEKIASLIIKVNSQRVKDSDDLKFTPDNADYGLLFDATSSTPTSGAKFTSTRWDFGNGIKRSNSGNPRIERIRYGREGDYTVTLTLKTNEGKTVTKTFTVSIHDPIAKIEVNREDGYIGDKFTFSAKSSGSYRDLTYNWEIIDIEQDKIVYQKSDKLFTYTFTNKGKYNVRLKARRSSGEVDQDTHIIYVTSQAPIAEFESKKPFSHKPNRVYLDASRSFDPDFTDDGNLDYSWFIDGNRVTLEDANANGSVGYYTFASVGTHSVSLEVTDPDGITSIKKGTVDVTSILSVEMFAFPRVIARNGFIKFVAESPEAQVYEWDFGDGQKTGGNFDKVTHTYEKSGAFDVILKVSDADSNTNTFKRTIYVSESDQPFALIDVSQGSFEKPLYDAGACEGVGAYVVDRVHTLKFDGGESINIDGETSGLEYSWKIGQSKFSSAQNVSHRFDEIGCFSVKLSVKSIKNGKTHKTQTMMSVRNVKPTLSSLAVQVEDPNADPLVVRVNALGAADPDGVIQSYLWYYYTDIDTQPQDFRATSSSQTAFVIPKITGNYYFVAILKDNNEARITSEEVTGARYFTTVTGDNINTPIVELAVNNNSVVIGEDISFIAKAHNILGQNIEKDASFSWDFDGDGFYDTQTSEPTTNYKYKKSGEFYAKVKVKYRGISSTKNVTINVSNKLVADFDYISIGNRVIFFDTSSGQVESRTWDLGDGTKKTGTYFEHTYTDKKTKHEVSLKIVEGTKVKEITKTVTKNIRNILKAKKEGVVVFTSPGVDSDNKIVLDNISQKVFVYAGESSQDALYYAIDYDIENDSDLNGGADDDEDNAGTASYVSGDVIEIPLSNYKVQKIRIFIKDAEGNIGASRDIEIEKTYIEEVLIDPDMIIFEGVSDSEREKIESLKQELKKLPQQQKIKALSYVQKLQENWNDNTEKTRTILDFENYIFELGLVNEDALITLLESLLVEGQEDQSAQQIAYQALVNLVPQEITCVVETGTCYDNLLSKLEDIRSSDDIDTNKLVGKEVLEVIGTTEFMTNTQKLDFKAILKSLVYGGNIDDIPDDEKQEVIDETPTGDDTNSLGILGVILSILKWIGYFLLVFILLVAGFYVIYLIFNKDKSLSFSEFISKTTSFGKSDEDSSQSIHPEDDILGDMQDSLKEDVSSDILSTPIEKPVQEHISKVVKQEEQKEQKEEVPDWLKGNFNPEDSQKKPETKPETKPEKKIEEVRLKADRIPKKIEQKPEIVSEKKFDLEKDTKLTPDENVPDWLKGSFDTKDTPVKEGGDPQNKSKILEKKQENTTSQVEVKKANERSGEKKSKNSEVKTTPLSDKDVPDWLKGSFDAKDTSKKDDKEQESKKETEQEKGKQDIKKQKVSEPLKKASQKKKTPVKKEAPIQKKKEEKETKKQETSKKTVEKKDEIKAKITDVSKKEAKKTQKKEELWDDGMKIPDWLKTDE